MTDDQLRMLKWYHPLDQYGPLTDDQLRSMKGHKSPNSPPCTSDCGDDGGDGTDDGSSTTTEPVTAPGGALEGALGRRLWPRRPRQTRAMMDQVGLVGMGKPITRLMLRDSTNTTHTVKGTVSQR
ncbi:MAG TPA: hypothetical protein VH599_22305 [Ktedonobacterales bacterium]